MSHKLKDLLFSKNIQLDNKFVGMEEVLTIDDYLSDVSNSPDVLSPKEFLAQAEYDFEIGGHTALVNSITNTKRAIQCQIGEWVLIFGIDPIQKKKKIEVLNQFGFAPRILKKVSDSRNLLEHQYKKPTLQEVEDALDLASIFISMFKRAVLLIIILVANKNDYSAEIEGFRSGLIFDYVQEKRAFRISPAIRKRTRTNRFYDYVEDNKNAIELTNTDYLYIAMLRLMLAVGTDMEHKIQKSLISLWDNMNKTE